MKDRIRLKIGEVSFLLAPLSNFQKSEIASFSKTKSGNEVFDLFKAQHYYVKYAVKGIEGVKNYDDSDYKLEFEGDFLSDGCVSEIFSMPVKDKLAYSCFQLLNEIPDKLIDPSNGEPLQGVELDIVPTGKGSS
jgi:hypothetical protein